MTDAVMLIFDGSTSLELKTRSFKIIIDKEVNVQRDDDKEVRCADLNRMGTSFSVTAIITTAQMETLRTKIGVVPDSTYPKIRIYDKSTTPFYNEYKFCWGKTEVSPMKIGSTGQWLATLSLVERTKP